MANANRFIVTTDWHVTSNDSEEGGFGETYPKDALAVSRHINSLSPVGVIDFGDCKDHYGADTGDELDNYKTYHNLLNCWARVNSGVNALKPILPGNHDKKTDYDEVEGATPYSLFDDRFWSSPYHWTCDWLAPQVRFIAVHTNILHTPHATPGGFEILQAEIDWLEAELLALPVGYKAFVCSHAPLDNAFWGNGVLLDEGGTELLAVLETYQADILASLHGHRHLNGETNTLDGVLHISCPALSYTENNPLGGFLLMEYNGTDTIKVHYRTGHPGLLGAKGGFTPLTFSV